MLDTRRQDGYTDQQLEHFLNLETSLDINIYKRVHREHITKIPQDLNRIIQVLNFRNTYEDVKAKIGIIHAILELIDNPYIPGKESRSIETGPLIYILNDNIASVTSAVIELMKSEDLSSPGLIALDEFISVIPQIRKNLFPEQMKSFNNILGEVEGLVNDIQERAVIARREFEQS